MAKTPLEVSVEVPIESIKYLVSAPISVLFFSTHRLPPQGDKGTVLLHSMQGQKTSRIVIFLPCLLFLMQKVKQYSDDETLDVDLTNLELTVCCSFFFLS